MNDDLISRKVLFDELSSLRIELNGISCRKEFKKTVKEVLDCVKHVVEDQPTAFDKEKVIEELKGEIELCVTHPLYPGRYIKKSRAIEIVEKGGGVNEYNQRSRRTVW